MNKMLLLVFSIFNFSSMTAQVEVCESDDSDIVDVNSIDKCVITHKLLSENEDIKVNKKTFILKRRRVHKKNFDKISKELIDKLISEDKVRSVISNETKRSSN